MLVTFRSSATETITMFQESALQLIKLMGHIARVPGALAPEDVPQALQSLEAAVEQLKADARQAPQDEDDEDDEDEDEDQQRTPPVDLATRAVPLLSLLRRAAAADAEVLWEAQ